MYREGQQQDNPGQEGREGQEFRMPQEEEPGQQGNPQVAAAYQQEGEQSQLQEQQPGAENEQQPQQGMMTYHVCRSYCLLNFRDALFSNNVA